MGIEVTKQSKMIDPEKLRTIKEYSRMIGKTEQRAWQLVKAKEVKSVSIRGKDFVVID